MFSPITDEQQRREVCASPLRINEVSAGNDIYINDYGKKADWVELYNTTDEDISLEGLYLSDNRNNRQKFQMTEGIVPAHGTCIIWCDGKDSKSQLHAPFKLENADGAYVSIQASDGSWYDYLEYQQQGKWQTFGRYPDGGNIATILNQPTIDKTNKIGMMDFYTLPDEEDGIDEIRPDMDDDDIDLASAHDIRAVQYFDLSGRQIHIGQQTNRRQVANNGIIIRKVIFEDGSTKVTKLFLSY
jgi:hypothetical protein